MGRDKTLEHVEHPIAVLHRTRHAVGVGHHVIPCGHDLAVLGLARVPARRDVGLGSLEHHH